MNISRNCNAPIPVIIAALEIVAAFDRGTSACEDDYNIVRIAINQETPRGWRGEIETKMFVFPVAVFRSGNTPGEYRYRAISL